MADKPTMVRGVVAGGVVEIPEEKAARMGSDFQPEDPSVPGGRRVQGRHVAIPGRPGPALGIGQRLQAECAAGSHVLEGELVLAIADVLGSQEDRLERPDQAAALVQVGVERGGHRLHRDHHARA